MADQFVTGCADRVIDLCYIQLEQLLQKVFIEQFTQMYRTGVLNAYVFESLEQVSKSSVVWFSGIRKSRLMTGWLALRRVMLATP